MGKEVGRPVEIQEGAAGIRAGTEQGKRGMEYKPHFCAARRVDFPTGHPHFPPTRKSLLGAQDVGRLRVGR